MSDAIEVRITRQELHEAKADWMAAGIVCSRLRAAGIPVIGIFRPQGITHGTLMWRDDIETDSRIYRWQS